MCRGNVCQSPYIERLLAARLRDLDVDVSSAGTAALAGQGMQDDSARLLRKAGIEPGDFVARQLTAEMLWDADLVLTATREIRREVVRLEPKALRYTHALIDFGDLVAGADLGNPTITEAANATRVGKLAARAITGRGEVTARRAVDAAIVDPYQKRGREYAAMAQQVGAVLPRLVGAAHDVISAADLYAHW
ncbi:hypothetical protein [Flexivirga alba]|uniref:Phosphotyrosine protein phosphatase I domain-containing protein n=1 Tax=Flexivirga alba TaxID=702742 RepID=A0ABW2AFP7_9MICO